VLRLLVVQHREKVSLIDRLSTITARNEMISFVLGLATNTGAANALGSSRRSTKPAHSSSSLSMPALCRL
jgi:hypothetical protein